MGGPATLGRFPACIMHLGLCITAIPHKHRDSNSLRACLAMIWHHHRFRYSCTVHRLKQVTCTSWNLFTQRQARTCWGDQGTALSAFQNRLRMGYPFDSWDSCFRYVRSTGDQIPYCIARNKHDLERGTPFRQNW